jgi:1-acyl-sn-glycerol-3-phosphate acyltransferase
MEVLSSANTTVSPEPYAARILRWIHTGYGLVVFAVLFFLFLPLLSIPIVLPRHFSLTGVFNRWWARLFFAAIFLPYRVEYRSPLDNKTRYIFCPNHFSYLDIPTLGLNTHNTIFVGKNDMERIPLFGFMYRKLHITVDREKLKSRYSTLLQSRQALDEGKSLIIFPEGGIVSRHIPSMHAFKDGAFRLAIEKQIPLVPVTIPYNWILLPDGEFVLRWHPLKVIFHAPVETKGMTLDQVGELKQRVFGIIDSELKTHLQK